MIRSQLTSDHGFAARLLAKATALARSHVENRLRARHSDAARWRKAHLLWPLFTKD